MLKVNKWNLDIPRCDGSKVGQTLKKIVNKERFIRIIAVKVFELINHMCIKLCNLHAQRPVEHFFSDDSYSGAKGTAHSYRCCTLNWRKKGKKRRMQKHIKQLREGVRQLISDFNLYQPFQQWQHPMNRKKENIWIVAQRGNGPVFVLWRNRFDGLFPLVWKSNVQYVFLGHNKECLKWMSWFT